MKKLILLGLFLITASISAQESLNQYKYIIVPKKFDFLKEPNQYRVNTLTKYLFEKHGFTAVYNDSQPQDLRVNPCLGLKANVVDESNLFTTKMYVTLENCQGVTVFTSAEGKSKIKDYEKAYHDAIEEAFVSIGALNYFHAPAENNMALMPAAPASSTNMASKASEASVATPVEETSQVSQSALNSGQSQVVEVATATSVDQYKDVLYAQPTSNGYQLVDSSPKVVYKLTKTTQPNYYLIQGGNGFVYKKDGQWIAEYYEGETLKQEVLHIKF